MGNKYIHLGIEFDENTTPKYMTKENFVNKELDINKYLTEYAKSEALKNYDINMRYFNNLDENGFIQTVKSLLEAYKFVQVLNLNDVKNKHGIYMLVLDNYKQIYIGQSNRDLKQRILRHFKTTIPFQKVSFIRPDTLPIDAFKPLDTTRVYVLYVSHQDVMDEIETILIEKCPSNYILNKTIGGKPNDLMGLAIRLSVGRIKKNLDNSN